MFLSCPLCPFALISQELFFFFCSFTLPCVVYAVILNSFAAISDPFML